jgi:transposase
VSLSPEERQELERWQRMTTKEVGPVRRGRIILLAAQGTHFTEIARVVGMSRRFVYRWVQRFQAQGLQGLQDRPRPGRGAGGQGRSAGGG